MERVLTKSFTRDEIANYRTQYIIEDDELYIGSHSSLCNDCPELKHEPDIGLWDCPCSLNLTDKSCWNFDQYVDFFRVFLVEADLMLREALGDRWNDEYSHE